MEKRLAPWKGRTLSIGDRVTLIKPTLANLLLYYLSLFIMPRGVVEQIISLHRRFLWVENSDGKCPLCMVSWDLKKQPKNHGGLGIGYCLAEKNMALLMKWFYRFTKENGNPIWSKTIKEKYGEGIIKQTVDGQCPSSSGIWKDIRNSIA